MPSLYHKLLFHPHLCLCGKEIVPSDVKAEPFSLADLRTQLVLWFCGTEGCDVH